jgi:hypothetical protein
MRQIFRPSALEAARSHRLEPVRLRRISSRVLWALWGLALALTLAAGWTLRSEVPVLASLLSGSAERGAEGGP